MKKKPADITQIEKKDLKEYNNIEITFNTTDNNNNSENNNTLLPLISEKYKIINEQYIIFKDNIIGTGSFGKVFYGMNIERTKNFAIKIEKSNIKSSVFSQELDIYNSLKNVKDFPKIHWSGEYKEYKVMILDLLGPSIDKFLKICPSKKFNLETTLNLGGQMIERIQLFHENDFIHQDIKPNNFLLGKFEKNVSDNFLYLVDFGLSKSYRDAITKKHLPFQDNKRFVGTPRYASINAHLGRKLSRRDDLESIGYLLFYFLKGDLPWQGVKGKTKSEKREKIKNYKILFDFRNEIEDLPKELRDFINYSKNLGFEDCPNYKYLIFLIESLKQKSKFCLSKDHIIWEWDSFFLNSNIRIEDFDNKKNYFYENTQLKAIQDIYDKLYEGYPVNDFFDFLRILRNKKNEKDSLGNEDYYLSENIQLDLKESEKDERKDCENKDNNLKKTENDIEKALMRKNKVNDFEKFGMNYKQNYIRNYFLPKGNLEINNSNFDLVKNGRNVCDLITKKNNEIKDFNLVNVNEKTFIGNIDESKDFDNDNNGINKVCQLIGKNTKRNNKTEFNM